jgi:hypothetical protein
MIYAYVTVILLEERRKSLLKNYTSSLEITSKPVTKQESILSSLASWSKRLKSETKKN